MTNRARSLAVIVAVLTAASLAACSSGPSSPHPWCAPLIVQFHAHESRQAYLNGLAAIEKQGAPVGKLITDETAYTQNQAAANTPGVAGFSALAGAPKVLARVSADLKELNAECGQAADAYKSDNA